MRRFSKVIKPPAGSPERFLRMKEEQRSTNRNVNYIYALLINHKIYEENLIKVLSTVDGPFADSVQMDSKINKFIENNSHDFSENLVKELYRVFSLGNHRNFKHILQTFVHLLYSKNLSEETLIEIYEDEVFLSTKFIILLNPKISYEFFEQEFNLTFVAEWTVNAAFSTSTAINFVIETGGYDVDKLSYLAKHNKYADGIFMMMVKHRRKVPDEFIENMKQHNQMSVRSRILSHELNSRENCQRDALQNWGQSLYFSILENPNTPDYILKRKVESFDYNSNEDEYTSFFQSLLFREVSEKIITLHSRSLIKSSIFKRANYDSNPIYKSFRIINKNIPAFFYVAFLVRHLRENNYKSNLGGELATDLTQAGVNVYSLTQHIRKMNSNDRFKYDERFDRREKMVFAFTKGMPQETMLKLANSNDYAVRQALAFSEFAKSSILEQLSNDSNVIVRLLVALNRNTNERTLRKLIEDKDFDVREAAYLALDLSDDEIQTIFDEACDKEDTSILKILAKHENTPWKILSDLIEYEDDEIKFNVLSNKTTPELYAYLV